MENLQIQRAIVFSGANCFVIRSLFGTKHLYWVLTDLPKIKTVINANDPSHQLGTKLLFELLRNQEREIAEVLKGASFNWYDNELLHEKGNLKYPDVYQSVIFLFFCLPVLVFQEK